MAIRGFVGIGHTHEAAPDATTLLKFRRLLETHKLTERIFAVINMHVAVKGFMLKEGTVVDATVIAAPSSTKNHDGKRDREMHQIRQGNQWDFGMKARIGVDTESRLTHTANFICSNDGKPISGIHSVSRLLKKHSIGLLSQ